MRAVIAGLGLIGGSLGMALRRSGWRVAFIDPALTQEEAREHEAADEKVDGYDGEGILVVATPVDVAVAIARAAGEGVVTSACSVMRPLRAAAASPRFVAGHPMAGSERRGLAAASGDLFRDKVWFVDREENDVRSLIEAAGARPLLVEASQHDEVLAVTSHLPQLLSTALASLIERERIDPAFFGSGLRTFLRLAGSSYEVWEPVLEANRDNIVRALDELMRIAEQIDERDFDRAAAFDRRSK